VQSANRKRSYRKQQGGGVRKASDRLGKGRYLNGGKKKKVVEVSGKWGVEEHASNSPIGGKVGDRERKRQIEKTSKSSIIRKGFATFWSENTGETVITLK